MTHAQDTAHSRDELATLVTTAAATWTDWTTARDTVAATWRALYTTPAPLFPGRVLALLDAHANAARAARAWDRQARTLALYTLQDEAGNITTWADMADIMGTDTDEWSVSALEDYPPAYGPASMNAGPLARQADELHHTHRERLADMGRLIPAGVLEVAR